jgi:hypothetical protein
MEDYCTRDCHAVRGNLADSGLRQLPFVRAPATAPLLNAATRYDQQYRVATVLLRKYRDKVQNRAMK